MKVRELIKRLALLTPEQQDLEVFYVCDDPYLSTYVADVYVKALHPSTPGVDAAATTVLVIE